VTIEPRYVIDTSVIVSALLRPQSIPRQAFDLAFDLGRVIASQTTLDELSQVLNRSKFDRYITRQERHKFVATFIRDITLIEVSISITDCRDPEDNKLLELAVSGRASCIISGDDDLLTLHPFQGIEILRPQAFGEKQLN
jgi:hypothetical protein